VTQKLPVDSLQVADCLSERGAFEAYPDDLVDFVQVAGSVEGLFNAKGLMPAVASEEDDEF